MSQKTNAQLINLFNAAFKRGKLDSLESLLTMSEQEKMNLQMVLIEEEVQETKDAIAAGDWEEIKDGVGDILVVTYGLAYVMDVDADKIVREINDANMSKLCKTQDEVMETTKFYQDQGVDVSIDSNVVDGEVVFLVKSKKDQTSDKGKYFPQGKFLKNVNWREPDLFGTERPANEGDV